MRILTYSTILILILSFLIGCKTKYVHVPVETIKTEKEYVDKWYRDSIHVYDSIYLKEKGDTVFSEKHKYIYKDRIIKDSIIVIDSIKVEVPYPVIETKEVNRLKNWQIILMCLGGALIGYWGFKLFKRIK